MLPDLYSLLRQRLSYLDTQVWLAQVLDSLDETWQMLKLKRGSRRG